MGPYQIIEKLKRQTQDLNARLAVYQYCSSQTITGTKCKGRTWNTIFQKDCKKQWTKSKQSKKQYFLIHNLKEYRYSEKK